MRYRLVTLHMRNDKADLKSLSPLERLVVEFLWANGPSTAESVRESLMKRHPMKEATTRTILRRLESKGYATHVQEGRTYIYSAAVAPTKMAMRTIRQLIDKFWGGSAHAFVTGMVENEVIDPAELRDLSKKLELLHRKGRK
jgi:BlaI family penicillinase repressor